MIILSIKKLLTHIKSNITKFTQIIHYKDFQLIKQNKKITNQAKKIDNIATWRGWEFTIVMMIMRWWVNE